MLLLQLQMLAAAGAVIADAVQPTARPNLPVIDLISVDDRLYDVKFDIGTPEQVLQLRLDIANGDIWVPGTGFQRCSSDAEPAGTEDSGVDDDVDVDVDHGTSESTKSSSSAVSASSDTSKKGKAQTSSATQTSPTSSSTLASSSSDADDYSGPTVCASLGAYVVNDSQSGSFYSFEEGDTVGNDSTDATLESLLFSNLIAVDGFWATDNVSLTAHFFNQTAKNTSLDLGQIFFIDANYSDVGCGGLGFGIGDNSFLKFLVEAGYIESQSYSLALNPDNSTKPELYLGGVTKSRYTGNLCQFDYIPVLDQMQEIVTDNNGLTQSIPVVPLSGFGVTSNSSGQSLMFSSSYDDSIQQGSYPRPALLDSRTYYNYLPFSTMVEIAIELNGYYASDYGAWIVDCNAAGAGAVDVYLGNVTISMQLENLLYPAYDDNGTALHFPSGSRACFLAMRPDYYFGYSILGTPFLRHAYVAFDEEGKHLAIAQAATGSDIESTKNSNSSSQIYGISSGSIPFAKTNNITSYSTLTLTISSSISISNYTLESGVVISSGEVYLQTSATSSQGSSSSSTASGSASGYTTYRVNSGADSVFVSAIMGLLSLLALLL